MAMAEPPAAESVLSELAAPVWEKPMLWIWPMLRLPWLAMVAAWICASPIPSPINRMTFFAGFFKPSDL
ncbi:hypothetical protein D3C86_2192430 [compost metagenome]